jgi:ornithine cyclodeaminase
MIALSSGQTQQLLRSIIPLANGRLFGIMPGAMGERATFGAKLVSVFPENSASGAQSHQGVVVLFDPVTGAPVCIAHAGEITAIRTAAASAVATQTLARPDAHRLAILGYGEQAVAHARAISLVRKLDFISVWGRSAERAQAFATQMENELTITVKPFTSARACVIDADIICTVTAAKEPILEGKWVCPGAHVNIVGSSYDGPVEVDNELVTRARFIADSREGVLNQGAEFLRAKRAGLISDDHVVAEIGDILSGRAEGRQSSAQLTAYKSLGHIVQDLASAWLLYAAPQTTPLEEI